MVSHGATEEQAVASIHCMDRRGLLLKSFDDMSDAQAKYADVE